MSEKYSLEKAQEEAQKLEQKVESREASNYAEAEKQLEQKNEIELSPEQIEKIMEKVQDINKPGTAFSFIDKGWPPKILEPGRDKLQSVFDHGLLGHAISSKERTRYWPNQTGFSNSKEEFENRMKKRKASGVWFYIIGRDMEDRESDYMTVSRYGKAFYNTSKNDVIGVIFDISPFTEEGQAPQRYRKKPVFGVYENRPFSRSQFEYGFMLSPQVPPACFRGIVFGVRRKLDDQKTEKRFEKAVREELVRRKTYSLVEEKQDKLREELYNDYHYVEENDPERLGERAREIAKRFSEPLPIYDINGNLWWPQQMSYQEVKKFIKGRDVKKDQIE